MSSSLPTRTPRARRPRRVALAVLALLVGMLGLAACENPTEVGGSCTGYRDSDGGFNRSIEASMTVLKAKGYLTSDGTIPDEAALQEYVGSDQYKAAVQAESDQLASKYLWQEGDTSRSADSSRDNLICRDGTWHYLWSAAAEDLATTTTSTTTSTPTTSTTAAPTSTTSTTSTTSSTTMVMPTTTTTTLPGLPAISLTLDAGTTTSTDYDWPGNFDGTGIDDHCAWAMTDDPGLVGFGDGIIAFVCQGVSDTTATLRLYVFDNPPGAVPTDYNGSDTGYQLSSLDATVSQGGSSESFGGSLADSWFDWSWQLPYDVANGDITVDINSLSYGTTPTQAF
jgi:hypothetical protein